MDQGGADCRLAPLGRRAVQPASSDLANPLVVREIERPDIDPRCLRLVGRDSNGTQFVGPKTVMISMRPDLCAKRPSSAGSENIGLKRTKRSRSAADARRRYGRKTPRFLRIAPARIGPESGSRGEVGRGKGTGIQPSSLIGSFGASPSKLLLPLGIGVRRQAHSSLRGRRLGRHKLGPECGLTHQSLKVRAAAVAGARAEGSAMSSGPRPAGHIRRSGSLECCSPSRLRPARRRRRGMDGTRSRQSTSDALSPPDVVRGRPVRAACRAASSPRGPSASASSSA